MLKAFLRRLVTSGRLTVVTPRETIVVGTIDPHDPVSRLDVAVRITSLAVAAKLAIDPDLYLGEAYMNGDLVLERGSIWDLLDLVGHNRSLHFGKGQARVAEFAAKAVRLALHRNDPMAARRNVAHHYDLSGELYRLFLDSDLQYSCAYFRTSDDTLEQAQVAKKQHIAAKLLLAPNLRVLDIGCGWGGLALSLARAENVRVHGITLSQEQLAVARGRAEAEGLSDRVTFDLIDYRQVEGRYDRIVSVGMFEHVGPPQYPTFFETVARLLEPSGVALVHSIGKMHGPAPTNSWIRKYIFPGGYIPAVSEIMRPLERSGLWLTDLEILRLHYAETLRAWRERFMQRQAQLSGLYDDRFRRMWEFYLAGSEMSFRHHGYMVFQAQLSKAIDAVPLTRGYLQDAERKLRASGAQGAPDADVA